MGQSFSIGAFFPLSFRIWLGKKLYGNIGFDAKVWRVSRHRLIKPCVTPNEVEALQYVAQHTEIPVPKVFAIHTYKGHLYLEMEYIPGMDLATAWRKEGYLTAADKKVIFADIGRHISTLRKLKPPTEGFVGSALQNPLYDSRIGSRFFGPMNVRDFISLNRWHLVMDEVPLLGEEVLKVHTSDYRTVFTHADLIPRNIIIRDGRVAAIVDWGFSGWYPEFWEFTKAHFVPFSRHPDWYEGLRDALPCYETELVADKVLFERLGEPGTPSSTSWGDESYSWPGSKPSDEWLSARSGLVKPDMWSVVLARWDP